MSAEQEGAGNIRYDYAPGSNRLEASEERRGAGAAPFAPRTSRRLEYNDAGRLWRLHEGDPPDQRLRAEYIYNGMGQRTRKVVHEADESNRTTVYHYDLRGMLITETDASGMVLRDYLWANGQPVAQIEVAGEAEQITYLYPDHLMTTRLGMDETGTVVWRWEGEAFGESEAEEDPDGDGREVVMRLRFPGQYHDTETNLFYNWNRYYDPTIGRYITSDPIGLVGGANTYLYTYANPLRFIDPTGLYLPNFPEGSDCHYQVFKERNASRTYGKESLTMIHKGLLCNNLGGLISCMYIDIETPMDKSLIENIKTLYWEVWCKNELECQPDKYVLVGTGSHENTTLKSEFVYGEPNFTWGMSGEFNSKKNKGRR